MKLSHAEQEVAALAETDLKGHIAALTPATPLHSFLVWTLIELAEMASH